jgi:hypothetical protein
MPKYGGNFRAGTTLANRHRWQAIQPKPHPSTRRNGANMRRHFGSMPGAVATAS